MIHKIFVNQETDPAALKKLYRKKLMTGGAVIRLESGIELPQLCELYEKFCESASQTNLQTEVLEQIACHPDCSRELAGKLESLGLRRVSKVLAERELVAPGK
ncbi:MAG: hypothetical protein KDD66_06915 [Bdellovibrionales bacterium]|nr:hypothetical protein [Bdellovibrionales bacterium]